jgi:integrase
MKATEPERNGKNDVGRRQVHGGTFAKVLDGRKQAIRGLWVRNGRYYAQLSIENPITGQKRVRRIPVTDKEGRAAETVPQAIAELNRLKVQRTEGELPTLRRTPRLGEYAKTYVNFIKAGEGMKRPATIDKDERALAKWTEHIGHLRVDQIKPAHVSSFIQKRLNAGVKPRTVNLDVISLRCALKQARADGWIQRLPTEGLRPLKTATPKRALFSTADLEAICKSAFEKREDSQQSAPVTKNAQEFVDYVRFMAYSGSRMREALAMRWEDVGFDREQLTVGAEGDTKNRQARTVDFNEKLKAHLLDMKRRSRGVSRWLFPSPQRGDKDIPAKSFYESLHMVRRHAGKPGFGFHDLRHHFISMAVMSGVDYMTIASWVGHQDGGVLIGKVYGHLANEHKKAMAGKLNFGPVALEQAVNH